jgi:hypothetical protein
MRRELVWHTLLAAGPGPSACFCRMASANLGHISVVMPVTIARRLEIRPGLAPCRRVNIILRVCTRWPLAAVADAHHKFIPVSGGRVFARQLHDVLATSYPSSP